MAVGGRHVAVGGQHVAVGGQHVAGRRASVRSRVLLDMHMHVMTGLEALRLLKDLNAVRPCILITSEATDELKKDAEEADAHSVLSKPVRRRELCTTIADALVEAYDAPSEN